jgi:hypothetical protein
MKAACFALALGATVLSGCATSTPPRYDKEMEQSGPGLFGDLRWNIDLKTGKWQRVGASQANAAPASAAEQEEFKKWSEQAGSEERREFEEWRAWQEWKKKNPK